MLHKVFKESEFSPRIVITFQVMTFARMSPGDPDSVRSLSQSRKEKLGTHAPGAGNPYNPDIGRIFHSPDTGKVCCSITAPVAEKADYFWFSFRHNFLLF